MRHLRQFRCSWTVARARPAVQSLANLVRDSLCAAPHPGCDRVLAHTDARRDLRVLQAIGTQAEHSTVVLSEPRQTFTNDGLLLIVNQRVELVRRRVAQLESITVDGEYFSTVA